MPRSNPSAKIAQFGVFELDLRRGELRKNGVRVKLQDQPLKVLELLLEHRGEVVSRDELRAQIWPANTFVEFDQGLYSAMARLRDALGDSSESPRFIETVARRGYRFIGSVVNLGDAKDVNSSEDREKARQWRRLAASVVAGLLGGTLLLGVLFGFDVKGSRDWLRRASNPSIHSIAVLPLENLSGDTAEEYFADGMTDELITKLAGLSDLRVVSRTSVMRYKKTSKPLPEIGKELGVDALIEGTVERSGNRVRIRVQLVQASADRHLWAQTYDRELRDALLLESEAARDIVLEIQPSLTAQQQQRLAARQVDPEAHEAYLKGLYFSNKRSRPNFERALQYFEQAIARDPSYARAYSGICEALIGELFVGVPREKVRARATWAAEKAVELDPSLPEAHSSLGGIHEFFDWDWRAAEEEYERALALDQNSAAMHQDYAVFLTWQGRFDQAIAEAQRSQDLDPVSPFVLTAYCLDLSYARRYDEAIKKCREALEFEPDFLNAHRNQGQIYEWMGKYEQALVEYEKYESISGNSSEGPSQLSRALKEGGARAYWRKQVELGEKQGEGRKDPMEIASYYARLGDADRAMEWLNQARREDALMEKIKVSPSFDNVRSDPRFQGLLEELHLRN